jgi:hypothetical protein
MPTDDRGVNQSMMAVANIIAHVIGGFLLDRCWYGG